MMILPGYAFYKAASFIMPYCCGRSQGSNEDAEEDEATAKARAKKERKDALAEKRGGRKFVKH